MRRPLPCGLAVLVVWSLAGCWGSAQRGAPGGMGGAAGAGGSVPVIRNVGPSGLPIPATTGVAKPAGAPGNLTVLSWAGFKSAVSWTFDDSQPSQVAHYAELNAVGVPMTFYINSSNSGGLTAVWTKAVQDGHEIGNHSVHHCHADLTGCTSGTPLPTLDEEIDQCTTFITQSTPQKAVWTMASPFGDNGYNTPAMTRFLVNRGVGSGNVGAADSTDLFNLPIYMAVEGDTAAVFNGYTESARSAGRWIIFLVHSIEPTDQKWYQPVAIGEVTSAMRTAGANPEIWSDTLVAIAAYWRAQKLFQAATPTTAAGATTWTWTLPPHFPPGKFLRVKVDGGTLTQGAAGAPLVWDTHGYYEIALDAGTLTLAP